MQSPKKRIMNVSSVNKSGANVRVRERRLDSNKQYKAKMTLPGKTKHKYDYRYSTFQEMSDCLKEID